MTCHCLSSIWSLPTAEGETLVWPKGISALQGSWMLTPQWAQSHCQDTNAEAWGGSTCHTDCKDTHLRLPVQIVVPGAVGEKSPLGHSSVVEVIIVTNDLQGKGDPVTLLPEEGGAFIPGSRECSPPLWACPPPTLRPGSDRGCPKPGCRSSACPPPGSPLPFWQSLHGSEESPRSSHAFCQLD